MPTPITEWDGTQNFSQIETIQDETISLLNDEVIDELADEMTADLAIGVVGRGAISTDASTDFWILYGCQISGTNPGSRTVTAGAILYQNQIYHVSAKTVTTTGSEVVVWEIVDNSPNVHETKEMEILDGVSGSGIKDEEDPTIYRMGEWINSDAPSSGLALSFTAGDTVSYNTPVYRYTYRRNGNTLEVNFYVSVNITDASSSLTRIYVPLPDGFTKKDPTTDYFAYGTCYLRCPTGSSTEALMLQANNSVTPDGDNKITLYRTDNATGTILMSATGTMTVRGNITLEIE